MLAASFKGDFASVQKLLENGIDVNAVGTPSDRNDSPHESTIPLVLAAQQGHVRVMEILIAHHADLDARTEECDPALLGAAYEGYDDAVKLLLDHGVNSHVTSHYMARSALHEAALEPSARNLAGKLRVIDLLVNSGLNINVKDEDGCTPLHLAAQSASLPLIQALHTSGADVNAKNVWGDSPLTTSATHGSVEAVQYLLSSGAQIQDGFTGLWHAVSRGHTEVAACLLEWGARPLNDSKCDPEFLCAARLAAHNDNSAMIHLLSRYGFEDQASRSVMKAALIDQPVVVDALVKAGAPINITDPMGRSALHLAVLGKRFEKRDVHGISNPRVEMMEYLLNKGVDVNLQDKDGNTAIDIATQMRLVEAVERFERYKASN
ncbi:MAG: hypothetical protein Q9202_003374 [Teloschistes flavicans]